MGYLALLLALIAGMVAMSGKDYSFIYALGFMFFATLFNNKRIKHYFF